MSIATRLLTFKEKIVYTELKEANEQCSFETKKKNGYLFKGVLLHKLQLERSGSHALRHVVEKVNFDSRLSKARFQLYQCKKKRLQSKYTVYLEGLYLEFNERDGLVHTYANAETNDAILRPKNKSREGSIKNNHYRHGYYPHNASLFHHHRMGMFSQELDASTLLGAKESSYQLPITNSEATWVRKACVKPRKKRPTIKAAEKQLEGPGYTDLVRHGEIDNSALLLPLDDTLAAICATTELNLAMENPSLTPCRYNVEQPSLEICTEIKRLDIK